MLEKLKEYFLGNYEKIKAYILEIVGKALDKTKEKIEQNRMSIGVVMGIILVSGIWYLL